MSVATAGTAARSRNCARKRRGEITRVDERNSRVSAGDPEGRSVGPAFLDRAAVLQVGRVAEVPRAGSRAVVDPIATHATKPARNPIIRIRSEHAVGPLSTRAS